MTASLLRLRDGSRDQVGPAPAAGPCPVLFVQFTGHPSGSPVSGLLLVRGLLAQGFPVCAVFGDDGAMRRDYAAAGCSTEVIPHGTWLRGGPLASRVRRWRGEMRAFGAFRHAIARTGSRLVYINTLTGISAAVAARTMGVPTVWHVREVLSRDGGEAVARFPTGPRVVSGVVRHLSRACIFPSRAAAASILGRDRQGTGVIIPNAVAEEFITHRVRRSDARHSLGVSASLSVVGVPGPLRAVKGHHLFLDAFSGVLAAFPETVAVFAGDGDDSYVAGLQSRVRELGFRGRVLFPGNQADMRAFYAACDVCCIPSRSESFGRTVIEAFACGTPVVATATGGIPEIVTSGRNGLLVPLGDPEALAGAVCCLLGDTGKRAALAREAYGDASHLYRESSYQERIADLVRQTALRNSPCISQ